MASDSSIYVEFVPKSNRFEVLAGLDMPAVPREGETVWINGADRKVKRVKWLVSTDPTVQYDGVLVEVDGV